MASISSRRSCFSARPPRPAVLPGGGSSGAMIAHWASVVAEDGYTAQRGSRERRSPPAVWVGQDAQVQGGEDDTRTPGRWWPNDQLRRGVQGGVGVEARGGEGTHQGPPAGLPPLVSRLLP